MGAWTRSENVLAQTSGRPSPAGCHQLGHPTKLAAASDSDFEPQLAQIQVVDKRFDHPDRLHESVSQKRCVAPEVDLQLRRHFKRDRKYPLAVQEDGNREEGRRLDHARAQSLVQCSPSEQVLCGAGCARAGYAFDATPRRSPRKARHRRRREWLCRLTMEPFDLRALSRCSRASFKLVSG